MGSPLSPNISNSVLLMLKNSLKNLLNTNCLLYVCYVDILKMMPIEKMDKLFQMLNGFHGKIHFTIKKPKKRIINCMNIRLSIANNKVVINWYQNDIWSGRYLSLIKILIQLTFSYIR